MLGLRRPLCRACLAWLSSSTLGWVQFAPVAYFSISAWFLTENSFSHNIQVIKIEHPVEDVFADMTRFTSSLVNSEIEQLLIDIVHTTSGGGNLPLELVEQIFQLRTGFALLAHENTAANTRNSSVVLEYIKSILLPDSPLIVNCESGCLSLRCEKTLLDCSEETRKSLPMVITDIRESAKITELDLSRRCFLTGIDLLKICKSARFLKRLVLRDIQILTGGDEFPQDFSLLKMIKWYCPALDEVDVTGCSQVTLNEFLTSDGTVKVVDLFSTNPVARARELLMPEKISNNVSNVSSRIKALVQEGVPANISCDGWTFLHTASAIGDTELVLWLLDKNADFKFQSVSSCRPTALNIAMCCHNEDIVKLLLDESDDLDPCKVVDLCLFNGEHDSLCREHTSTCNPLEVVKLVIERSSLNFKTTFLVEFVKALERNSPRELKETTCWTEELFAELFKVLVSCGCSPDFPIKDLGGKTLLMCAVTSPALVEALLDLGANIDATDQEGNTALFYASGRATIETTDEQLQACQIILNFNASANASNIYAETPLLYAGSSERLNDHGARIEDVLTKGSSVKILELLLQSGAKVTAKNKDGKSIMHLVVDRTQKNLKKLQDSYSGNKMANFSQMALDQCIEQVKYLSKCNKQVVMFRDSEGNTPLHVLADEKSIYLDELTSIAKTLIESGSKVNICNDQEKTPLHLVRSWKMAKFLLQHGAKPNPIDDMGCTPLMSRLKKADLEGPPALEAFGEWTDGLNYGMDPWQEDNTGQNVFTVLMENANFAVLRCFIDAMIKTKRETILKTDSKGNSLLHYLCGYNDSRVITLINYLLQTGANVNVQNENGDTALHIVCRNIARLPDRKGENSVYCKLISRLRSYGTDCSLKNNAERTVFDIVWFNKSLLRTVRRKPVKRDALPFISWIPASQSHRNSLSQVVRRQNCQSVEEYWYYEEPIGIGAFGNVYAAVNEKDGREVALKRTDTYRLRTRQAEREVNSLLQLSSCPQIVQYVYFIKETDFTWIVLELMEGNLVALLQQGIKEDCIPKLCNDLLLGINHLHENNILHRDLKPSNVLYTYDHEHKICLKIADFGLSKNIGGGHSPGSRVFHSQAGSKCWMARELLVSSGPLQHTFSSDVFACGLIMHYMLAKGRHPFDGSSSFSSCSSSLADRNAVEQNITSDIKTLSSDLSDEARDLLGKVLSKEKDDRPKASEALRHPFFWSNQKKVHFLCAVGSQSEVGTFRSTYRASPVEQEIENNLTPTFLATPWDTLFPVVYPAMTSSGKGRPYVTTSGVHLVRFIRNAYAHVSDRTHPTGFQDLLLKDYIFLTKLPYLLMIVFKAVKLGNWDTGRQEIANAIGSH